MWEEANKRLYFPHTSYLPLPTWCLPGALCWVLLDLAQTGWQFDSEPNVMAGFDSPPQTAWQVFDSAIFRQDGSSATSECRFHVEPRSFAWRREQMYW